MADYVTSELANSGLLRKKQLQDAQKSLNEWLVKWGDAIQKVSSGEVDIVDNTELESSDVSGRESLNGIN